MKSGTIGGVHWKTDSNGVLHLSGTGSVSIDTDRKAEDGMMQVEEKLSSKLSMCPGCKQWLPVVEGELEHDDLQTVKCVLEM